jgi:hypothetical protein
VSYDFESLTNSPIHGQDNWFVHSSFSNTGGNSCPPASGTAVPPNIISTTSSGTYSGSKALTGTGRTTQHAFCSRVNNTNWSIPSLAGAQAVVIEVDWNGNWSGAYLKLAFDSNNDGNYSIDCSTPDNNEISFGIGTHYGGLNLYGASGNLIDSDFRPGEWFKVRLCVDLLANSGQGAGSIFYRELNFGGGAWAPHPIANVNMGFNTSATNQTNYANIDGIMFEMNGGNSFFDNNSFIDNLVIDVYYSGFPGCVTALSEMPYTFKATVNEEATVDLSWTTTPSQNISFFHIERSSNGVNWESIQIVEDWEGPEWNPLFETQDLNPMPGRSFYRLVSFTYDGKKAYSEPEFIELLDAFYTISPNPTSGQFSIQLENPDFESIITVTNVLGQEIHRYTSTNERTINFDLKGNSGIYFVSVKQGNNHATHKVIKR